MLVLWNGTKRMLANRESFAVRVIAQAILLAGMLCVDQLPVPLSSLLHDLIPLFLSSRQHGGKVFCEHETLLNEL